MILYSDDSDDINTILDTKVTQNNKTVIIVPTDSDTHLFSPYFLRINANKKEGMCRIRGLRARNIIFYKVSELNKEIHDHILRGLCAVSSDPIQRIKKSQDQVTD